MSTHVNHKQAADIANLKRGARGMDKHQPGTTAHIIALATYNTAFNNLIHQGMSSAKILNLVGVKTKSKGGK